MSSENDLLKQATEKFITGVTPTPFFNYTPSQEEQRANANWINAKAAKENEGTNKIRWQRWREGGFGGLVLGIILTVVFFYITKLHF